MTPRRPTGVIVIAILNIVLGAFGLLGGLCALTVLPALQSAMPQPAGGKDVPNVGKMIQDELEKQDPNNKTVSTGQLGLGLLLGLGMIVGAIGLLKLQPWGRTLTMAVAALELLIGLVGLGYAVAVTLPATERALTNVREQLEPRKNEQPVAAQLQALDVGAKVGLFAGLGVSAAMMVYYVIVLLVLNGAKAKAAFAGAAAMDEGSADYDDRRRDEGPLDYDDRHR